MRVHTVFAAAGLILAAASATACSGGSAPASAPPATAGATSSSGSSATGNAGTSSSVKNFDVCSALPTAAASQITGIAFTTAKSSAVQGLVFSCEYDGPNSALLQITIETQDGKNQFDTDVSALKEVGHPATRVTGVGNEAFSEPNPQGNAGAVGASGFASYGAVFGDTYIKIGGLTYVTAGQGKQIVEVLHSKL